MSKYKVGDELIIVTDHNQETKKLKDLSLLKKDGAFACLSWGIKIVDVLYEKPEIFYSANDVTWSYSYYAGSGEIVSLSLNIKYIYDNDIILKMKNELDNKVKEIKDKFKVMSVPAIIVNDEQIYFGAKKIDEIINIISK